MIKDVIHTSQFRKDLKKVIKQGKNYDELEAIVERLVYSKPLDARNREHALSGN